jgi:hypothetical protein
MSHVRVDTRRRGAVSVVTVRSSSVGLEAGELVVEASHPGNNRIVRDRRCVTRFDRC